MRITNLSEHNYGWRWDHETGSPGILLFSAAVQVWSVAQDRPVTVNEAALAFNVAPALIRQAVECHDYMFISDEIICHDGE